MQRLIEVRLLVAIVTLSEELNFTNAAKRLGITQSGLSRRVASLEKKYRIKLFERDHANVTLTEAGQVFIEEAKLSLMHNERAIEVAKAVTAGVESVLTIGRSPFADPFLTSALLPVHLPLYPNLQVHLHSDFAPELLHNLTVSKLDLALVANPGANRKLTTTKIGESRCMWSCLNEARRTYLESSHGMTSGLEKVWRPERMFTRRRLSRGSLSTSRRARSCLWVRRKSTREKK